MSSAGPSDRHENESPRTPIAAPDYAGTEGSHILTRSVSEEKGRRPLADVSDSYKPACESSWNIDPVMVERSRVESKSPYSISYSVSLRECVSPTRGRCPFS